MGTLRRPGSTLTPPAADLLVYGNDAEAICEAVSRPSMRFVPVKSIDQQAVLTLHRVRQGFIEERTATINRIRGLLAEFGVVLPQRAIESRPLRHFLFLDQAYSNLSPGSAGVLAG
jgi:transposase